MEIVEADTKYFNGYVSVAALIIDPKGKRLLAGRRKKSLPFMPGCIALPSRRVREGDSITSTLTEVVQWETGYNVDYAGRKYLGDIEFSRESPVIQLCFGLKATSSFTYGQHGDDLVKRDIFSLEWMMPEDFCRGLGDSPYGRALERKLSEAQKCGLLQEKKKWFPLWYRS